MAGPLAPIPGASQIEIVQSGVSTAGFPAAWQKGEIGTKARHYRLFVNGAGSIGDDAGMETWRVDFSCDLTARLCTYEAQNAPPKDAFALAHRIGDCLTGTPVRPKPRPHKPAQATMPDAAKRAPPDHGAAGLERRVGTLRLAPVNVAPKPPAAPPQPMAASPANAGPARNAAIPKKADPAQNSSARASSTAPAVAQRARMTVSAPRQPSRLRTPGVHTPAKQTVATPAATAPSKEAAAPAPPGKRRAVPKPPPQLVVADLTKPHTSAIAKSVQGANAFPLPGVDRGSAVSLPPQPCTTSTAVDAALFRWWCRPMAVEPRLPLPNLAKGDVIPCWGVRLPNEPPLARAQRLLLLSGLDAGPVDGKFGKRTRTALQSTLARDPAPLNWRHISAMLLAGICNQPSAAQTGAGSEGPQAPRAAER